MAEDLKGSPLFFCQPPGTRLPIAGMAAKDQRENGGRPARKRRKASGKTAEDQWDASGKVSEGRQKEERQ